MGSMIIENGYLFKLFTCFWNHSIIYTEKYWIRVQKRRNQSKCNTCSCGQKGRTVHIGIRADIVECIQ